MPPVWIAKNEKSKGSVLIKSVQIGLNDTSLRVKERIFVTFELSITINVRLRNSKGNIVPINRHLPVNSKKAPYKLETYELDVRQPINTDSSLMQVFFFSFFVRPK